MTEERYGCEAVVTDLEVEDAEVRGLAPGAVVSRRRVTVQQVMDRQVQQAEAKGGTVVNRRLQEHRDEPAARVVIRGWIDVQYPDDQEHPHDR